MGLCGAGGGSGQGGKEHRSLSTVKALRTHRQQMPTWRKHDV